MWFGLNLVDSLEISKSEQSQIIETDNELQKEFEKELEQLQIKYRKKLVKSLGDEKSTKFNELFGEFRKIGLRALKF